MEQKEQKFSPNRNLNHLKQGTAGRLFFTHNVYFKSHIFNTLVHYSF